MAKSPATRHHPLSIGVLAAVIGVMFGIGIVYWDTSNERAPIAQAAGSCPQGNYNCPVGSAPPEGQSGPCVKGTMLVKVVNKASCPCACNKGPGPLEQMCDSTLTCDGKKLEGKPKEEPKEEGKGGEMPKLPEMPKGGGGEPKPPVDPCTKNPTSTECKGTQTPSGLSGFLNNIFNPGSSQNASSSGGVSSALQSAASKLQSFFSGESTTAANTDSTNSVNNPTEAVVTPVTPTASQAGQITSQSGSSQQGTANTGGTTGVGSTVTGFGSGAQADVNTQSGPIVAAMKGIVTRIQGILSSLFQ